MLTNFALPPLLNTHSRDSIYFYTVSKGKTTAANNLVISDANSPCPNSVSQQDRIYNLYIPVHLVAKVYEQGLQRLTRFSTVQYHTIPPPPNQSAELFVLHVYLVEDKKERKAPKHWLMLTMLRTKRQLGSLLLMKDDSCCHPRLTAPHHLTLPTTQHTPLPSSAPLCFALRCCASLSPPQS